MPGPVLVLQPQGSMYACGQPLWAGSSAAAAMQLASASGEARVLEAAKQGLGAELERVKGENRDLLQKAALLDSLTAEAEALRHQVCPATHTRARGQGLWAGRTIQSSLCSHCCEDLGMPPGQPGWQG